MNSRAFVAVLVLSGCGPTESRDLEPTPLAAEPQRQPLLACDGSRDGIIIGNALSTNDLLLNTLITNRAANYELTHHALDAASFATVPELRDALLARESLEVLKYIVSCALTPADAFSVTYLGTSYQLRGQVGLCPAWATLPAGATPGDECLESVSACLLARNNAYGFHVPLSVRGDDSLNTCFDVGSRLHGWGYRPGAGEVNSFEPCDPAVTLTSAARDCGWTSERVFTCAPGSTVTVAAGAPAAPATPSLPACGGAPLGSVDTGDMVLRLCEGISACDRANALAYSEGYECRTYLYKPTITVSCPASGFVTVMTAPWSSPGSGTITLGTAGLTPVDEESLFPVREGAFYGTVFDPDAIAYEVKYDPMQQKLVESPTFSPAEPVVFLRMHACADEDWADGDWYTWGAHRDGRTCAFGVCATQYAGRCETQAGCLRDPSGGELRGCTSDHGAVSWRWGLTTFLNQPCDLSRKGEAKRCARK